MQTLSRIETITSLEAAAAARLVVEAIIEKLDVKRGRQREWQAAAC